VDVERVGGGGFDCNHYLVTASDEALIVDAGTGFGLASTRDRVEELLGDRTLDRIYLTHWHHDHVGGAPALAEAFDAELVMPEAEAEAVREGRADLTLGEQYGAEQQAHPVTGIEPETTIAVGDVELAVLHTPGHTAGHTSLWHADSGTLLAGDAVFSQGSFGRVDLPTGDGSQMLSTLKRLADLDVENLYPGHVEPVEGGGDRHVEMALSNARGRL
jgi:glyoxylase-like metal-dependent hydrolase (beta-lactamase superfamily II)